ncbi:MAG: flavin reductase [Gammaproteobacteria bacterium]|nr:flavin reductase [Gammaproteobacteria bacterium]
MDEQALFKIQYGMYIVSSKNEEAINGQIATTVMQVTNDPIKIAICLSKNTYTHEMVKQSQVFGVSVLAQDTPMTFIGRFGFKSGREFEKCKDISYETNITGVPLFLEHTVMILEAKVLSSMDIGTHTIYVGELLSSKQLNNNKAMTYEYYHTVFRGKSPENAPTHIKNPN